MPTKPGTKNFSGPIPEQLKDRIDSQISETKLPMGRIIESLAEFWANLTTDEQKMLCYGVSGVTLRDYIHNEIGAYLHSDAGKALLDEIATEHSAPMRARTHQTHLDSAKSH